MAKDSHRFGLIDYVAVVVSPGLVMLMVGSLVFFLVEVLYQGKYEGRLLYTMFFFVFGAVLIARLSIQFGRKYAAIYGVALGAVTLLAMMAFVKFDGPMAPLAIPINIGLMALIWWSADKLTWDCTDFDEARKASGRGVLAAAGLDQTAGPPEGEPETEANPEGKRRGKKDKDQFLGWVERYHQYRLDQKKKPHTPGVWVLYFGLAAIPLFALGQSLIDPKDAATRRAAFFEMAVYVGSALALLVTTTLFGLKRYLEERGAKVPPVMVGSWLGLGAALIVGFLVVGAVLPRPHSETPLVDLKRGGGKGDRKASKNAVIKDSSSGEGKGSQGGRREAGDGKSSGKGGKQGGGNAGEKGGGGGKGDSQGGKQQGGKQQGGDKGNSKGGGESKSNDKQQGKANDDGKKQENSGGPNQKESDQGEKGDGDDAKSDGGDGDENQSDSGNDNETSSPELGKVFEVVGTVIKWIVWIAIALAVIAGIVWFCLRGLAPFTKWAQNLLDWLKGLFGRKAAAEQAAEAEAAAAVEDYHTPFASFDNPFADGSARHRDPRELVEYSFAALDAWAWDRDKGRAAGETPIEFAVRIGHEYEELDEPAFRVANLYARVLYSRSPLPADVLKSLAALWSQMEGVPARA